MKRVLFWILVVIPGATLFVTMAVANRHLVRLVLDPFHRDDPVIYLEQPLFVYLFGMLFFGMILGWAAGWLGQGKWRRTARERTREAVRWKIEAERLARRSAGPGGNGELPSLLHGG